MFDGRFARRMASRYRRRGLDRTARRMVDLLAESGLEGATVLEIGGGVGEIHLELLRRGAASPPAPPLCPAYRAEGAPRVARARPTRRGGRRRGRIPDAPAGL